MLSYPPPFARADVERPFMQPPDSCEACRRVVDESLLDYRRGNAVVHQAALLQCDICERFACADCLRVYDILSGYDFLCHECARELEAARVHGGH